LLTDEQILGIVTRILLTYAAEIFGSLAWMGALAQAWSLPMLIYMNVVDISQTTKWVGWTVLTLIISLPSGMFDISIPYCLYGIEIDSNVLSPCTASGMEFS
jgi:nitrate/nitrite transporter NarK